MSDWNEWAEAVPSAAREPAPRKIKRHKVRKVTISVQVSKEDREKYMRIGGAKWLREKLAAAAAPAVPFQRFGQKVDGAVMMCKVCGADRFKEPCQMTQNCALKGIAE